MFPICSRSSSHRVEVRVSLDSQLSNSESFSENYDKDKAAIEYQLALTHNPFLWSSFQQFAQLVQHDQPPTTSSLTNIVDVSPYVPPLPPTNTQVFRAKPAVIVTPLPVLAAEMIAPPLAPKKTRRPPVNTRSSFPIIFADFNDHKGTRGNWKWNRIAPSKSTIDPGFGECRAL